MSVYTAPDPRIAYTVPNPRSAYTAPKPMSVYTAPDPRSAYTAPNPRGAYTAPKRMSVYTAPDPRSAYTTPNPRSAYTAPDPRSVSVKPSSLQEMEEERCVSRARKQRTIFTEKTGEIDCNYSSLMKINLCGYHKMRAKQFFEIIHFNSLNLIFIITNRLRVEVKMICLVHQAINIT